MATLFKRDGKLQIHSDFTEVDRCRSVFGGKWNKKLGVWEYPITALPFIQEVFGKSLSLDSSVEALAIRHTCIQEAVKGLIAGETEPREHSFLMRHQRLCRDIALYHHRYAWYMDVGTGKTLTAYSIISENTTLKWLVICPKSIIYTAWVEDHLAFYPHLKVLPVSKSMTKADYIDIGKRWGMFEKYTPPASSIRDYLMQYADVVVTNPEAFKADKSIAEWPHGGLIVDESSILRNMKSQTTKTLTGHAQEMQRVYLLSGKPAPNNEDEYFPQMLMIDPALFGVSYYKFRDYFFHAVDYFGHDFKLKPALADEFARRLALGSIFINKHDCIDLPPELPPVKRLITLGAEAAKYYRQMEKAQVVMLQDKTISVNTKLASLMKLRQITSGFVLDTDDDGALTTLHNSKINELADVLSELGDNKAIIWINFKAEVSAITDLLTEQGKTFVTAYSGTKNVNDSITAFKNDDAQFIIAHPQTLKYGVTFTGPSMKRNCTYAIYYSMSYSLEDYYQSHARIYRKGQTESCTYIFLLVERSIDEVIFRAVMDKGDAAQIMENMSKQYK